MDPEQRLFVILEYLTVKFQILFLRTLVRMLRPERMGLVEQLRTLLDLELLLVLFLLLLDLLHYLIRIQLLVGRDRLCVRSICLGQIDLCRHKGTVFLDNLSGLILIAELQAVFIDQQRDLCTDLGPRALFHIEFRTAVTLPVYRLRAFLPGQRVDMHLVRHHKRRIEAQTEMSDDLILIGLVLVLLDEIRRTGKSDLVDILLHLVRRHTDTVINKLERLLLRVHDHLNLRLITVGQGIFPHHVQLLQLRNCITAVGDQFPEKDIMVGIQPLLDDRENIVAVN